MPSLLELLWWLLWIVLRQQMDSAFAQLNGRGLLRLYADTDIVEFLFPHQLSENGPATALNRIYSAYGLDANFLYSRCTKFVEIATFCQVMSNSLCGRSCSVVINAPHTHWAKERPIVYSFDHDKNRYIVGNQNIRTDGVYRPVSFVGYGSEIRPYEWIDSSVVSVPEEWDFHYKIISDCFQNCIGRTDPIGLGVGYRFSSSLFDYAEGSVEFPLLGESPSDFSQILSADDYEKLGLEFRDNVRVAWPCQPNEYLQMNELELELLERVRDLAEGYSIPEERERALNALFSSV